MPRGRLSRLRKEMHIPREISPTKKCYRKLRHEDQGAAGEHLEELLSKPEVKAKDRLVAYPCEICGGWHVGHLKKGEKVTEQRGFMA